jgi:hypothetical protein
MTTPIRNHFEDRDFTDQVVKVLTRVSGRKRLVRDCATFMGEMWKLSVKKVGKHQAKEIMRQIMGDKKPGPSKADEDDALDDYICAYISHCGPKQSDEKIAKRLLKSKPYYVQWKAGLILVGSDEFQGEEHPAAKRTPINIGLSALEKRVERVRRRAIDDGVLAKDYSPRRYYRDGQ